jgi:hypothetical protein
MAAVAAVGGGWAEPLPYLHPNWAPAKTPPPTPGYRVETCLMNAWPPGSGWGTGDCDLVGIGAPEGLAMAEDIAVHLRREYGPIGITIPYMAGEAGRAFARYMEGMGCLPLAEGHNKPSDAFLAANRAFALDIRGRNLAESGCPDTTHAEDMTHPAVLEAVRARMMEAARSGAQAWRSVDYVWQWWGGGVWGYSKAALRRWREDLEEEDAGLQLGEGFGAADMARAVARPRIARFWEYFRSYHGYRMRPANVGLATWDDYAPPREDAAPTPQRDNAWTVFALLFHYEWTKFINEAARPPAALGCLAQPICNPEFYANGTDLYWLFRCAFVRGCATEWWGGADVLVPTYYAGRYYDNAARRNRKEIVFLGESAAAGGSPFFGRQGRPNYWDNMAGYLISYAQAASVDAAAKHDQYWGSSWGRMTDPARREHQAYTAFRSAWCGFLQARHDGARKPKTDLLAVTQRPISRDCDSFDRGWGGQPYNLGRHLYGLNYLHDAAAFPMDDSFRLEDYRVILYTPFEPPAGFARRLAAWLSAKPERVLITHSFVPTRYSAPAPEARPGAVAEPQAGGQERMLGFAQMRVGEVKAGLLKAGEASVARALGGLVGREVSFARPLYVAPGGRALASVGGAPLVSERRCGRGRVIYLHFLPAIAPGEAAQGGAVSPAGLADGFCGLGFDLAGGRRAFVTYSAAARTDVAWGGETFPVYQAEAPGLRCRARFLVGRPGSRWRVADMITGRRSVVPADADGYVSVDCGGWSMRGVYLESIGAG